MKVFVAGLVGLAASMIFAGVEERPSNSIKAPSQTIGTRDIRNIESCMERLRGKIEEWGVVTASVPIIMKVGDQFRLDKGAGASEFPTTADYIKYQQSNVAGSSFQSSQTAFTNQLAASAKPEVQSAPAGQPAPAPTPPLLPDININNNLGAPTAPGALLDKVSKTSGIPGRAAVLLGVNDKLTERILTTMAGPPFDKFVNKDYAVYFAIVQVSVNPGWRTRENYIADLTSTCEYYNTKTEKSLRQSVEEYPRVFSVLPLIDAQNLELGNSDQRLTALVAQVSAAYPTVGLNILGQDLVTFVHRYQKDSVTRSPVTVTNSYSEGHTFGFRFAPAFTAQADPAYRKSRAANILAATAFPVLVTVITKPEVFRNQKCDSVVAHISTRWLIKDRPPLTVWYKRLYTPMKRNTVETRLNWAADAGELKQMIKNMDDSGDDETNNLSAHMLRSDALELVSKCGPQDAVISVLPKLVGEPTIGDVEPTRVPSHEACSILVTGVNLRWTTKVVMGGKQCSSFAVVQDKWKRQDEADVRTSAVIADFPEGPVIPDKNGSAHLLVITDEGVSKPMSLEVFETKATPTPTSAAPAPATPTPIPTPAATTPAAATPPPTSGKNK